MHHIASFHLFFYLNVRSNFKELSHLQQLTAFQSSVVDLEEYHDNFLCLVIKCFYAGIHKIHGYLFECMYEQFFLNVEFIKFCMYCNC